MIPSSVLVFTMYLTSTMLTIQLPEVINMKLLPIIISLHYPASSWWEYSNLPGRSCCLDQTPNLMLTNLQGNVLQLEGRITNQILGVKGFDQQATLQLILLITLNSGWFILLLQIITNNQFFLTILICCPAGPSYLKGGYVYNRKIPIQHLLKSWRKVIFAVMCTT